MEYVVSLRRATVRNKRIALPRRIALLGGTTTFTDCLVALRYLVTFIRLIRGQSIAEYERAFAKTVGARHAVSFNSGRVGLYGVLRSLGIGLGDEVLLQVPTHIVVANAIRYLGARPVYVDCRPDTFNMDLEEAERRVTLRTRALVLQHTFGLPADIDKALDLTRRHGLDLIEDCVHSLGATHKDAMVGTFGKAGFFSTEETKTITTTMGGMVVTDDPELAAGLRAFQADCAWPTWRLTVRYLLKFLLYPIYSQPNLFPYLQAIYQRSGSRDLLPTATTADEAEGRMPSRYAQRLSNAQAALGLRQLRRLEANLAHRKAIAAEYHRLLGASGLDLSRAHTGSEPAFVRFPVWVDDRPRTLRAAAPWAALGDWFTSVLEESADPTCADYEEGSCLRAESAARHLINLPTHPNTRLRDARAIARAVSRAKRSTHVPGRSQEA